MSILGLALLFLALSIKSYARDIRAFDGVSAPNAIFPIVLSLFPANAGVKLRGYRMSRLRHICNKPRVGAVPSLSKGGIRIVGASLTGIRALPKA